MRGVERADSWATDCHKWLNVPYDSAFVACADPAAHRVAMSWQAAYVVPTDEREPYAFVPEASRRARAFAVWCALRELGRSGVAAMVERCCANAQRFAEALAAEPGVEVLNDVTLNQVLVRFGDDDERTAEVIRRVQDGGTAWLSGSRWHGVGTARISCTNWATTSEDVDRSVAALLEAYRLLGGRAARAPAPARPGATCSALSPRRRAQVVVQPRLQRGQHDVGQRGVGERPALACSSSSATWARHAR